MKSETDAEFELRLERTSAIARVLAPYLLNAAGIKLYETVAPNVLPLRRTPTTQPKKPPVVALAADDTTGALSDRRVDAYWFAADGKTIVIEASPDRRLFTLSQEAPASGVIAEVNESLLITFLPDSVREGNLVAQVSLDDGVAFALALQTAAESIRFSFFS